MRQNNWQRTVWVALACFLVLYLSDFFFITHFYHHLRYLNNAAIDRTVVSLIGLFAFLYFIKKGELEESFYQYLILFVIYIPILVHFAMTANDYAYFWYCSSAVFVMSVVLKYLKLPIWTGFSFSENTLTNAMFLLMASFIGFILFRGGLAYWNLDFSRVYEYRSLAAENLPPSFSYIASTMSKVISPLLLVLTLKNKRYFLFAASLGFAFMQFGLLAHKESLFNPIVTVFLYWIARSVHLLKYMLYGFLGLMLISFLDGAGRYFGVTEGWLLALFNTRVFMAPAMLTELYIRFFGDHELYEWCYSKISLGLWDCPYEVTPPFQIAQFFFNSTDLSANTGVIGAGFAQLGWWGAVLYAFLMGASMRLLANYAKTKDRAVVIATSALLVFNQLSSTDWLTSLLSHGFLCLLFFYLLLPAVKKH